MEVLTKFIPANERVQILLIEDDPSFPFLLRFALDAEAFSYELTTLADGEEAMVFFRRGGKYADSARPDVVLMDLRLPKRDGIEILTAIRASEEFTNLPVVVVSSSESRDDKRKVNAFKRTRFVSKPCDLGEFPRILEAIRSLMQEGETSLPTCATDATATPAHPAS